MRVPEACIVSTLMCAFIVLRMRMTACVTSKNKHVWVSVAQCVPSTEITLRMYADRVDENRMHE